VGFSPFAARLLGLSGGRFVMSNQLPIGDAPSRHVPCHLAEAAAIVGLPLIEAECLFDNVGIQVHRLNANLGSFDGAFEQRPEIFQPVCVNGTAHVLNGVVNGLVHIARLKPTIRRVRVGVERRARSHSRLNLCMKRLVVTLADVA
jgi:hypothetical protein